MQVGYEKIVIFNQYISLYLGINTR